MCGHECSKSCPVNKKGEPCIVVKEKSVIDEKLCVGCGICQNRCPFDAIEIINLPSVSEKDMVHRYGQNGFALYSLPIPKQGSVLGFLGRNGIGKSTAVRILSNQEKMNLGREFESEENRGEAIRKFFSGSELMKYFDWIKSAKVSYKPQNLSSISVNLNVEELLLQRGSKEKVDLLVERLKVGHLLSNKLNELSGGELQKVAIIASVLGEADIYFFDEPLAFLDIQERLNVSDFIREISKEKTVVVVEHDLLILDYLADYLNIFYGSQGSFGLVSGVKASRYGVNSYLQGFLKEENLRIRDKELNFNFSKNVAGGGVEIGAWQDFELKYDNFSLSVRGGEIKTNSVVGVLGKNGTGKTSFIRALAGEQEVLVNGEKKKIDFGRDLSISYKKQYLVDDSDELVRNVMFKEKINKKISSRFNLGVLMSKKMSDLSGGELQRLAVARCLSKDADIYLIDEPSAYLDVEERISVAKAIKEMMIEKEKTAFVVDHDLLLVSYLADEVVVFEGESGKRGIMKGMKGFEAGISLLLESLGITLRKDKESGRPKINDKGSVLDREQKQRGEWVAF